MKCAIVLADGVKQIMFAPENENEKQALQMITVADDITIETKHGSFYENYGNVLGYKVNFCHGGWLRAFADDDCVMLVLTPKKKEDSRKGKDE